MRNGNFIITNVSNDENQIHCYITVTARKDNFHFFLTVNFDNYSYMPITELYYKFKEYSETTLIVLKSH